MTSNEPPNKALQPDNGKPLSLVVRRRRMRLIHLAPYASAMALTPFLALGGAAATSPITDLYEQPPSPCVAKSPLKGDPPLAPFVPYGSDDPVFVDHMAKLGTMFFDDGQELLEIASFDAIYTAFFQLRPHGYEVGVYGYEFSQPIDASRFKERERSDFEVHFLDGSFLALVWHDAPDSDACFDAINSALETWSQSGKAGAPNRSLPLSSALGGN